jgi:hypothetical protein
MAPVVWLRWAIDGCLAWQRIGLVRAKVVLDATAEYFSEQDGSRPRGLFISVQSISVRQLPSGGANWIRHWWLAMVAPCSTP